MVTLFKANYVKVVEATKMCPKESANRWLL